MTQKVVRSGIHQLHRDGGIHFGNVLQAKIYQTLFEIRIFLILNNFLILI